VVIISNTILTTLIRVLFRAFVQQSWPTASEEVVLSLIRAN